MHCARNVWETTTANNHLLESDAVQVTIRGWGGGGRNVEEGQYHLYDCRVR
jgi:hypothetical protein